MAPGMAHNPSQPGTTAGGIPHQLVGHMGVSGPGPQMNAAALMGGMPPGNPNAHAMQHLNPAAAQAQMFHHPQMGQMGQMCTPCAVPASPLASPRRCLTDLLPPQTRTTRPCSSRCSSRGSNYCSTSNRRDRP